MHPHCNRDHTFRSKINLTFLQNVDCVNRTMGSYKGFFEYKTSFSKFGFANDKKVKAWNT